MCAHKAYCYKTTSAHGARLDFLSFLTGVLSFIVDFAKALTVMALVGCIFMLIRLLPSRIRGFVSAFATSLLFIALFRLVVQHFSILAIKTIFSNYLLYNIKAFTVLFCLYILIGCGAVLRHSHRGFYKVVPFYNFDVKRHFARRETIFPSNSFLMTSPVLLQ